MSVSMLCTQTRYMAHQLKSCRMHQQHVQLTWIACFIAIIVIVKTQASGIFQESTKTCNPECSRYGNCNGETGQCDCPFGLTGPACTQRLFPACHSTSEPGSLPHYGTWYPKNCHCVEQLREHPLTCPPYLKYEGINKPDLSPCLYDIVLETELLCYRYTDRPESEQLSDSPPLNASNVEWLHVRAYPTWSETLLTSEQVPKEQKLPDGGLWRPLDDCPNKCSGRGWCQTGGDPTWINPEQIEQPWCKCHSFFNGPSCEIANAEHCYRNCSGVGTCLAGWCHCQSGYWGHGCTRKKAYTSSVGWRPNHAAIKVYVYDLPTHIVHRREFNDEWAMIDTMYNAEIEFTERILDDWTFRTENPWEAALFYVPMFTYFYTGNIGHPYFIMQHVVHHLQHLGPFFNATAGRNHIMWATNDRGTCKLQMAQLELQHPIKLVHFGQTPRRSYARANHLTSNTGGTSVLSEAVHLPLPGHRFPGFGEFNAGDIMAESLICIRIEKDVVTPNCLHNPWVEPGSYGNVWDTRFTPDGQRIVTRKPDDAAKRNITLYFAGFTQESLMYSQGVRQAIHSMFGSGGKYDPEGPNARQDYIITGPVWNAAPKMRRSKFCLAPMGAGWGIRLSEAMVTGCVPVIIQDHVYQPLWDVLPFEEFSIRLSRTDVPLLVEMLDDVTPEQLATLQAGVERYHRAFMWDTHYGGMAYNYTVTALKRRALSMWSVNFHRHQHRREQHHRRRLHDPATGGNP